jgi:hypothetical protein
VVLRHLVIPIDRPPSAMRIVGSGDLGSDRVPEPWSWATPLRCSNRPCVRRRRTARRFSLDLHGHGDANSDDHHRTSARRRRRSSTSRLWRLTVCSRRQRSGFLDVRTVCGQERSSWSGDRRSVHGCTPLCSHCAIVRDNYCACVASVRRLDASTPLSSDHSDALSK